MESSDQETIRHIIREEMQPLRDQVMENRNRTEPVNGKPLRDEVRDHKKDLSRVKWWGAGLVGTAKAIAVAAFYWAIKH